MFILLTILNFYTARAVIHLIFAKKDIIILTNNTNHAKSIEQ